MTGLLKILSYARPHRAAISGLVLLTAVSGIVAALQPWPLKFLVDTATGSDPFPPGAARLFDFFGVGGHSAALALIVVLVLVLFVVGSVCEALLTWGWTVRVRRTSVRTSRHSLPRASSEARHDSGSAPGSRRRN